MELIFKIVVSIVGSILWLRWHQHKAEQRLKADYDEWHTIVLPPPNCGRNPNTDSGESPGAYS